MSEFQYGIVIQGTLGEFSGYDRRYDLLRTILERPATKGVIVAVPSIDFDSRAKRVIEDRGASVFIGEDYNVALRVLNAHMAAGWSGQEMVVRVCSSWNLLDFDLIDIMVANALEAPCDYLVLPKDFDYTVAADIASCEALQSIANFKGNSPALARARFNPWAYLEAYAKNHRTRIFTDVPTYAPDEVERRLESAKTIYDENEFVGRDYAGSRYDWLVDEIREDDIVLDLATGSGHGASVLSKKASLVVGVDYLQEYIDRAKYNYPEHDRLRFMKGDAMDFVYQDGDFFSVAVSLHTIEHIPDERGLLRTLHRNLRPGGRLILEVPIMMRRPWGKPTNPYHLREYTIKMIRDLVKEEGFIIDSAIGGCRGIYFDDLDLMRGDYRLYAHKS